MDTLRRQASKLREQVAKQQQAVLRQFSASGYESSSSLVTDDDEMQRHQQIERLYKSTRLGKNFQRDIIKAAETFASTGHKQIEAGTKLSEDCCRYGAENISDNMLANAATAYGHAWKLIDKEQEEMNKLFTSQIIDPLRAMVTGASLEDARRLAQHYSRMRQEAETQALEVSRKQARAREFPLPENVAKLHAAEAKMSELKANMAVLGKEAIDALTAIEAQQQKKSYQRLATMVSGTKAYHLRIAEILENVEFKLDPDKQQKETTRVSVKQQQESSPLTPSVGVLSHDASNESYFLAEATHSFVAESNKELSLEVGDYVVVRKVSSTGWSEGECKGKGGWFPSAYVQKRESFTADALS